MEHPTNGQKAKLLAQIKHTIAITDGDTTFGEVIRAAWADFQNAQVFDSKSDAIALITGPLSALDTENARTLLEWARHSESAQEFFDKVNLGKFSSDAKRNKLDAFQSQLKKANNDTALTNEQIWGFLRCFHLLGYDLDMKSGVTLSLLNSHIAQFKNEDIPGLWAKIAKEIESFNQNAGTVTRETISEEITRAFFERVPVAKIPSGLLQQEGKDTPERKTDFLEGEKANALMYAALLGSWNEKAEGDVKAIRKLIEGND